MSSQTPNIGLTLPTGSENVSRQIINDNNTKIDTAIGGTAGRELLGYKENGNTASQAIADGSFVVWKGDLYKANGAISQGTAFSSSNLTAVPSGGFNDLQGQVSTLSDSIDGLVKTKILTLETVTFSAGTIGTRGQQFAYTDELSGKTLIGAWIHFVSDSTKFMPIIMRSYNNLYCNVYRSTSSAVSNETVEIAYAYI